jgi:crossover junction endodeoxyribonuclease RusA
VSTSTVDLRGAFPGPESRSERLLPAGTALNLFVPGRAAPQGSKRHVGGGVLVESSKAVAPWRTLVAWHVAQVWLTAPLGGPVWVELEFVMPRPTGTPKRRTPPAVKKPDLDKLTRAVFDALSKIVWVDDSVITSARASKRLAGLDEQPGAWITAGQFVDGQEGR